MEPESRYINNTTTHCRAKSNGQIHFTRSRIVQVAFIDFSPNVSPMIARSTKLVNLEHTAFLLAAVLGFFMKPDIERFLTALNAKQPTEHMTLILPFGNRKLRYTVLRIRWVIGIILFVASVALFFVHFSIYRNPEIVFGSSLLAVVVRIVNFIGAIAVQFILALVLGVFVRDFFDYLHKETRETLSPYVFFARLVTVMLLIVVGFFQESIIKIFRSAEHFETPYFRLEFSQAAETEARVYFQAASTETGSDFQRGVIGLLAATRAPFTDLEKIISFCFDKEPNPCLLPNLNIPEVDMQKYFRESGGEYKTIKIPNETFVDDQANETKSEEFRFPSFNKQEILEGHIYATALDYFASFQNFSDCLFIFSERFPNGLPILEEISEYAADYTVSLIDRKDGHYDAERNTKGQMKEVLERILDGGKGTLEEGDSKYTCELSTDEKNELVELMTFREEHRHAVAFYHQMAPTNTGDVSLDDEAASDGNFAILPYRSIFLANVLLLSGHRIEAARHLERSYQTYVKKYAKSMFGEFNEQYTASFIDFLWRLQFLAHIDSMMEVNSKGERNEEFRRQWSDSLEEITSLIGNWLLRDTNIGSVEAANLLRICAEGDFSFNEIVSTAAPTSEKPRATVDNVFGKSENDIKLYLRYYKNPHDILPGRNINIDSDIDLTRVSQNKYISDMVKYYLEKRLDYLSAFVTSGKGITDVQLQELIGFFRIAAKEPYLIDSCYPSTKDRPIARGIRAQFAFAAAEGFAFYAQELQEKEILQETLQNRTVQSRASRKNICRSAVALRFVNALLKDTNVGEEGYRIRQRSTEMLVAIGPNTCDFDNSVEDLDNILRKDSVFETDFH